MICAFISIERIMKINKSVFFDFYRNAFGRIDQSQVAGLNAILEFIEADKEILDVRWAAYMLATTKHECADKWHPIKEIGTASYFKRYDRSTQTGKRLGNTEQNDFIDFIGRGYVQITGRANYQNFGIADTPDKALEPATAYWIMSSGMRSGAFTGKKLSDYIHGGFCDYVPARRIINGTDRAEIVAGYAKKIEAALKAAINS